ncbi:disease resistance protein [Tanacetum coccineum]
MIQRKERKEAQAQDQILFPNLQELDIDSCSSLVSLPSNFPKLRSLKIEGCGQLRSLPDEIQSFKDLNEITIKDCEIISRRCEKDVGEDWPKISHIPHINIIRTPRSKDEHEKDDNKEEEDGHKHEDNKEHEDKRKNGDNKEDEDELESEDGNSEKHKHKHGD